MTFFIDSRTEPVGWMSVIWQPGRGGAAIGPGLSGSGSLAYNGRTKVLLSLSVSLKFVVQLLVCLVSG